MFYLCGKLWIISVYWLPGVVFVPATNCSRQSGGMDNHDSRRKWDIRSPLAERLATFEAMLQLDTDHTHGGDTVDVVVNH